VTRAELGGTIPRSAVGSYTGNGASSREIDVGFAPKLVVIRLGVSPLGAGVPNVIIMIRGGPSTGLDRVVNAVNMNHNWSYVPTARGFIVGGDWGNIADRQYYWFAIS